MPQTSKQETTNWTPTDKQSKVLNYVLENEFECSIVDIHEATGIARSTVYTWLNDDEKFCEVWNNLWETMISRNFNSVVGSMIKKSIGGDVPASRLLFEASGRLKQRLEVTGKDGAAIEHAHSSLDGRLSDIASRKGHGDDAGASDRTGKT